MLLHITVLLTVVAMWLRVQRVNYVSAEKAFKHGDIMLGALNVLHSKDFNSDECGDLFPVGVGHTEAMIFTIDQINKDPTILPDITLGYDIRDYCETISIAVKETYEFVRDRDLNRIWKNTSGFDSLNETSSCRNSFIKSFGSDFSSSVSVVIGPYDSASAVQIGSLLNFANVPILSFAATSDELSSNQYRYFMRTVPPDNQQARVQADLFEHFNWTYVGTVALDDSYGRFGVSALENESFRRKTFCIAFSEFIPRLRAAERIPRIVSRIKKRIEVQVIVVWVFGGYAKQFFQEVSHQSVGRRTWILGDATTAQESVALGDFYSLLDGALGVQPQEYRDKTFFNHLTSLTPNSTRLSGNPWWKDFWKKIRNCSVDIANERNLNCVNVPLSSQEAEKLFDPYLVYLTDALFVVAHSLDKMYKCVDKKGLLPGGACPQTEPSVKGSDLLSYLRNVSFQGKTGIVEFNENGDPQHSSFQILNVQIGKGFQGKVMVGTWNSQEKRNLQLNASKIKWARKSPYFDVPVSVCSRRCSPGTRKEVTTSCCWKCIKCPGGTVSEEPGSTNCTQCPEKQKSNDAKTKCVLLPVKNLQLKDGAGVFLAFVTAAGICVTMVTLLVFIKYRETAIVKASNRQLSFALLVAIFCNLTLALLSIAEPTDIICRVIQFSRFTIYTTSVSILWLKSVRIFVLFQVDSSDMPLQGYISKVKYQVGLVAIVNSVDLVLLTAWFATDPPLRSEKLQPTLYIFYTCDHYKKSAGQVLYFMLCSYVLLLSLLSLFYAFKVRKLPDNFNEARFIGFSLYIILLSAICYYTVEFSVQHGWYVSVIACTTTLVDSFGLLGCMFGPKVFNILFHPERNSKEAMSSQVAAYVWQNSQLKNFSIRTKQATTSSSTNYSNTASD